MLDLKKRLQQQKDRLLYRKRHTVTSVQDAAVVIDKKEYINFCSNDYLGLAQHPSILEAFQQAATRFGLGSGSSCLITGYSKEHRLLEEALADFMQRPRALIFSTGYMANLTTISALLSRHDALFSDRLNHASLIDAGILSRAHLLRYKNRDTQHLNHMLESRSKYPQRMIATDGVFSMDGTQAPLEKIAAIAQTHHATLMVDDAHGFGILGPNGKGSIEEHHLSLESVPILMATFGKALGTMGAFITGSHHLIETLIQFGRPYIYTTGMPPALAAATRHALTIMQKESWRRQRLHALIQYFKQACQQIKIKLLPSFTPIQPILLGSSKKALFFQSVLEEHHILVKAIRPPTVPQNTARLRITLSAYHTEQQIQRLITALIQAQQHTESLGIE